MERTTIDNADVARFFDGLAPAWDGDLVRKEAVIGRILDAAEITDGVSVLDAGCGTGVLIGDYLLRGARRVLGVDLSPRMLTEAERKFHGDTRVSFFCGDAARLPYDGAFDRFMVYNAFPHFGDPAALFRRAALDLAEGGRITIAHGMSREAILRHHAGGAAHVSLALPEADALMESMRPWFHVDTVLSDAAMYLVSCVKK